MPKPTTAPTWIESSPTRRDLIGAEGVILGSVTRRHGLWHADLVPTTAHSRTTRINVGGFREEDEARSAVQRGAVSPPAPALSEIARRFAIAAPVGPLTHMVRFTIPRRGSADEQVLAETNVGDTAASVVEYLGTGQLDAYVLTAIYAVDLTDGLESITNVTAAILRDVAAYVEAAAIELPSSLDDAFTRHGIPQPTAWVEANSLRDLDFESERQGPADCLDRRRAA